MSTFQGTLENWNLWNIQDKELVSLILGRSGGITTSRIIDLILQKPLNKNQIAKTLNLDYKTVQYHINLLEVHKYAKSERFENVTYIFPTQKLFNALTEYKINDAAVYLYQSLGKNDSALALTKEQTENAFNTYLKDEKEESYKYFLTQLDLCIKICQYTSEFLEKQKLVNKDTNTKEGDKLWFDLLKTLYNFEKKCVMKDAEKKISENIEDLLRKMCLHVSLQNIIETVTEIQKDAQYKEFKNILGDMLRSNNSFNRILENTKLILKHSTVISEEERSQSSIRGNCYNNKICDVCHKNFVKSKSEIVSCFGCGHQSHEKCAYCNNNFEECVICRREGIGDEYDLSSSLKKKEDKKEKEESMINEKIKKIKKEIKFSCLGLGMIKFKN